MKIQSLSIVIPSKKCINDCKFCVSKMHESEYEDALSSKNLYYDLYKRDYINRLEFARDNGCNTIMLTGDCEPLQNRSFLLKFGDYNQALSNPFKIIELQTVGNLITDDYLYFLRHHVGVTTISLSVSSFNDARNSMIIGCKIFDLKGLCARIKKYRFNLRLSINMTSAFSISGSTSAKSVINTCYRLGADQITFRRMYIPDDTVTEEADWMKKNYVREDSSYVMGLKDLLNKSKILEKLEFGLTKYAIDGMGIVYDNDCMSKEASDTYKYLILRENCKLYSKWDDKASLIF